MNRQEKIAAVEVLKDHLQKSKASFLVGYRGLDVASMSALRKQLYEQGGGFKVAKITLMRRAMQEVPHVQMLSSHLQDQIALVFSHDEPPVIAKILYNFAKEHEQLHIKVGCFESRVLDQEAIKVLATLPSREVLLAQVCGTMKAPVVQFAQVVQMVMMQLIWVIEQIQKKK